MQRFAAIKALCGVATLLTLTGCSSNAITSPSGLNSAAPAFAAGGDTRVSLNHYNDPLATGTGGTPEVSCPTQAPRIFHGGVHELRLELQWQPLYNVQRYQVEVERRTQSGWSHIV